VIEKSLYAHACKYMYMYILRCNKQLEDGDPMEFVKDVLIIV